MLGISEGFHPASHHQNNPAKLEALTKINSYHVALLAHLLERLKATPDGDGNLLDHSLIVYGSGMSDGNGHTGGPLPMAVIGGGGGQLKGNRHIVLPAQTSQANLLLSVAQAFGVEDERFGRSTGTVDLKG